MKKIVYVDMDGVLVDFASGLKRVSAEKRHRYKGREDEIPGIYALMDPLPGAVESFEELSGLFDTYVLSTAPWKNPSAWSDKLLWVKGHLGSPAYKRLILSHHKDLNYGAFLIDDHKRNGAGRFGGKLIRFGSKRFPDWPSVMKHLRSRAGERSGS